MEVVNMTNIIIEREKITKEEYEAAKNSLPPNEFAQKYEMEYPNTSYEGYFKKKIYNPSNPEGEMLYKIYKNQNDILSHLHNISNSVKFFVIITIIELVCQLLMSCSILG